MCDFCHPPALGRAPGAPLRVQSQAPMDWAQEGVVRLALDSRRRPHSSWNGGGRAMGSLLSLSSVGAPQGVENPRLQPHEVAADKVRGPSPSLGPGEVT